MTELPTTSDNFNGSNSWVFYRLANHATELNNAEILNV